MRKGLSVLASLFLTSSFNTQAKVLNFREGEKIDYKLLEQDPTKTSTYLVDKIEFLGLKNFDEEYARALITIKEKKSVNIPSPTIRENLEKLLASDSFEHIACFVSFIDDIHINLTFEVKEFPIIEAYEFEGVTKKYEDKLIDKIKFSLKKPASNKYLTSLKNKIKRFYVEEEGCREPEVVFKFIPFEDDKDSGRIILKIVLPEVKKTYVNEIRFYGNEHVSGYDIKPELKLREKPRFTLFKDILYKILTLQPLRENGYLRSGYSKDDLFKYFKNNVIFIPRTKFSIKDLNRDKDKILNVFSKYGYNDAEILKTKILYYEDGGVDLEFFIDEGEKFYINSINWVGNSKYDTKTLSQLLNVKKGDIFSLAKINEKIHSPGGLSSLYQDFGYLTSSIEPVVVEIKNGKVDLEMRVDEGDIYRINNVEILGNVLTFDEIIRRKLFVKPGGIFSRYDILLSMQALGACGLFDMGDVFPIPTNVNRKNKTADIIFNIKREKPKIQLKGSVAYSDRLVFSGGFACNNVSLKDILTFNGFLGGGQDLSFEYKFFSKAKQGLELSFDNPSLTFEKFPWGSNFDFNFSFDNENEDEDKEKKSDSQSLNEFGVGIGFYKQLPWENGNYTLLFKPSYKFYKFSNYKIPSNNDKKYNGISNELTLATTFARDTKDDIFFPRKGSRLVFNLITTPPYGLFKKFEADADLIERLKWRDFASVTIEGNGYFNVYKDVVLTGSFKHGHSFSYSDQHITNKYTMGGGIANKIMPYGMLSLKNVPLRGYSENQFKLGKDEFGINGANYFDVMTAELRVMLFDLGMLKMFGLGFVEAGILYNDFKSWDIENLKRSYGFGFRVLVPMFGVVGIDWGRGIDNKKQEWEFHFQIGA